MTARMCAFLRAYHSINSTVKVFDDTAARLMLTDAEYGSISQSLADGASFFFPGCESGTDDALGKVVCEKLAPTPLGRAAFIEDALKTAVRTGTRQYIVLAAGYDTFALRQPEWAEKLRIYELDRTAMSADKLSRILKAGIKTPKNTRYIAADMTEEGWERALIGADGYDPRCISFFSLSGLSYYVSKEEFSGLTAAVSSICGAGSAIAFDYPSEGYYADETGKEHSGLAAGAGEAMRAGYEYPELESLLSENGFLIYELLTPEEITDRFFSEYNKACPARRMQAQRHVNYCLAVKKGY